MNKRQRKKQQTMYIRALRKYVKKHRQVLAKSVVSQIEYVLNNYS